MTIAGKIGSFSRDDEHASDPGHGPVIAGGLFAASQGELPVGLILSKNSAGALIPYAEEADEVIGTGGSAATPVTSEAIGTGTGTAVVFSGALANDDIQPGSVTITATVSASPVTITDDGAGILRGAGGGIIDYETGTYSLIFATAPDNESSITAGYSHTPPAATFTGTLAAYPVEPGSVSVTDGVETFSDDGHGRLTGSAGGTGTVNYKTGVIAVSFNANVGNGTAITADYVREIAGVLDSKFNDDYEGSGNYIIHGTCRADVLKVGAVTKAAPSTTLLGRLQAKGIYAR
jgi:hypothetical protein